MAIFKIISSRQGAKQDSVEFGILPIDGEIVAGDEFCCYETHHPLDYHVEGIQTGPDRVIVICSGYLGYNEQFVGAVIDMSKGGKRAGFRYDVP